MKYILSSLASKELEEGREYYDFQKEGLGNEFKKIIKSGIDEIFASPHLYPIVIAPLHRKVISRFPYSIFYRIDEDAIVILSIAHQHRQPFYKIK
jgi:plasmid stabilization system protein ParE